MSEEKTKSTTTDLLMIAMVILMSVGANLPDNIDVSFDRKYLLAGLFGIVAISLIKYVKFTFILVIVILAVGANLPGEMAAELNIDKSIMMFALVSMVVISTSNQIFKLPTGVGAGVREESTNVHGVRALFAAIDKGRIPTVRALLKQGVSANVKTSDGRTPLIQAAANGYGDIIQLLMEQGSDVNLKDNRGISALAIAKKMGHTRVVELLKDAGAQI